MGFRVPTAAELSQEQVDVFDLPADGRYLVYGPPGTGKTVLALLRAQKLCLVGRRPAILMYNRALQAAVSNEAQALEVADRVSTYHSWVGRMWATVHGPRAKAPTIPDDEWQFDWEAIAEAFGAIHAKRDRLDIDDVIVDEGQDLPRSFYQFLRALGSNVTVFADENQRLTDRHSTIPEIRSDIAPARELAVKRNYRNTREIATLAKEFYVGTSTGSPDLPDRPGGPPTLLQAADDARLARVVAQVAMSRISHKEVGVLVRTKWQRGRLVEMIPQALREVAEEAAIAQPSRRVMIERRFAEVRDRVIEVRGDAPAPIGEPGIFVICHASAKGLEFDSVVFDLGGLAKLGMIEGMMCAYVMSSRARHDLFITWPGRGSIESAVAVPDWVRSIDPSILARRTG